MADAFAMFLPNCWKPSSTPGLALAALNPPSPTTLPQSSSQTLLTPMVLNYISRRRFWTQCLAPRSDLTSRDCGSNNEAFRTTLHHDAVTTFAFTVENLSKTRAHQGSHIGTHFCWQEETTTGFKRNYPAVGDDCWWPTCQPESINSNAKALYCLSEYRIG